VLNSKVQFVAQFFSQVQMMDLTLELSAPVRFTVQISGGCQGSNLPNAKSSNHDDDPAPGVVVFFHVELYCIVQRDKCKNTFKSHVTGLMCYVGFLSMNNMLSEMTFCGTQG
jgi:hypothetical protein